tara:strand:- start:74 stop:235 length:162 start_codon:yes stop_codon:yes gene_type:complete
MSNIKKTDVIVAVRQALTENQGIGTYHIAIDPIIHRVMQLLEQQNSDKKVLLD